jgi:hypothetical protein
VDTSDRDRVVDRMIQSAPDDSGAIADFIQDVYGHFPAEHHRSMPFASPPTTG